MLSSPGASFEMGEDAASRCSRIRGRLGGFFLYGLSGSRAPRGTAAETPAVTGLLVTPSRAAVGGGRREGGRRGGGSMPLGSASLSAHTQTLFFLPLEGVPPSSRQR